MILLHKKLVFFAILSSLSSQSFSFSKSWQDSVTDWAGITTTPILKKICPNTVSELQRIVALSAKTGHKISIWGAGYSQGGQTAYKGGITIDMQNLNAITHFDKKNKKITVQTGATWKQILDFIDPYNLSISCMQSYYNFSVGGSLSVNAHGRNNAQGQIISTVDSIKIVIADGSLVTANRVENYDLFRAAIGGYGYVGVIVEATLNLTENFKLVRECKLIPVKDYKKFFFENIHNNPDIIIHNGNLYPNDFKQVLSIAWKQTDMPLTNNDRIQRNLSFYPVELATLQIARRISKTREWRAALEPKMFAKTEVAMRNNVIGHDTKSLQPLITFPTSHILQEYFIPCEQFDKFVPHLNRIINKYNVNVQNCSIRYVKKNTESYLSYAKEDSFSFVLYINILNTESGKDYTQEWTQKLIDQALICGGSFYLPYLLSARKDQLLSAYPLFNEFLETKKKYDPKHIFSNELFRKYVEKSNN